MIESPTLHMRHIRRIRDDHDVRVLVLDRLRTAQSDGTIQQRPAPHNDDPVIVALAGSAFAGFAVYQLCTDKRLWLDVLWVEPDHRRHGIATRLLHEVELAARRIKYRGVSLGHETGNTAMIALMERTGWPIDHIVRSKPL